MRVLVVEDDDLLGSAVRSELTRHGYTVDWIVRGGDLEIAIRTHDYACVLLDLGLPDILGDTLLKTVRTLRPRIPVVVMTARGGVQDRVALLDIGADDYMVKPIDLDELGARLRAVLRRTQAAEETITAEIEHGSLKLLPSSHSATWRSEPIPLTQKEYWLLATFLSHKTQVFTRTQLEEGLYSWGEDIRSNAVEVYVHNLRQKIGKGVIQTVRGVGYQLGCENALK